MRKKYDEQRESASERGYDSQWHKVREMKLNQDPLCEEHLKQGFDVAATIVHHIKPAEKHPELRLALENLMSVCNDCHEQIFHKGERWGR